MHFVGRVDWSFLDRPSQGTSTASGLARQVLVGPSQGTTHSELAAGGLTEGGWIARHVHAFEEALYLLEGELLLEIDRRVHHLVAADFGLIPVGTPHTLVAAPGKSARWLSINTPPRRSPPRGAADTIYADVAPDLTALTAEARHLRPGDPSQRFVGHYAGTPPQAEALAVTDPARGRTPAGMDTALLAYSGISVKMLIDRALGADLLTMFTVDYEVGGAAQAHSHPFEETYFFLEGEVQAELDGVAYTLRAGDVVFAGVDSVHGFWNDGPGRVRWIETQAPQPPVRNAYRWEPTWEGVARAGVEPWPTGAEGRA
jgi:quercetin dioxygenase-like cupin family protein